MLAHACNEVLYEVMIYGMHASEFVKVVFVVSLTSGEDLGLVFSCSSQYVGVMSLRGETKCSKGVVIVPDESRFRVLVTSQRCCNCMYLVALQKIRLELAEDAGQDLTIDHAIISGILHLPRNEGEKTSDQFLDG